MTISNSLPESATVSQKISMLRGELRDLPLAAQSASFAGTGMPTLGNSVYPANLGIDDLQRSAVAAFFLGSDWGNEHHFAEEQRAHKYKAGPFLTGARRIAIETGLDTADVWYGNAWPVLRLGQSPEQSHHPMRDDAEATNAYRDYLMRCMHVLRPRLIITGGFAAAWFMGPLVGGTWKAGQKLTPVDMCSADLDTEPARIAHGVVVVAATHPSHLNNRKYRTFATCDGDEAALLRRANAMSHDAWRTEIKCPWCINCCER